MKTGKVQFAPDYKSKEPRLPKDFGLLKAACADGKHRFLPDALKCGCGQVINPDAERERLEREVIEALKACHAKAGSSWDWIQPSGAYGPEIVGAWETLNERLFALIEFESQHLLKK